MNVRAIVTIRFYAELNDLLRPDHRFRDIVVPTGEGRSVKDLIETFGVPHTEVDLILCDGDSCGFDKVVRGGEQVSVYPVFEAMDITGVIRLRPEPLRRPAFILDSHLGGLLRMMRILGLDAVIESGPASGKGLVDSPRGIPLIVDRALSEARTILTRSRKILKLREVTHGYLVRSSDPVAQCREVLDRFDLKGSVKPLTACISCGGTHLPRLKATVALLLEGVRELYAVSGGPDGPLCKTLEHGRLRLFFRLTRFNRNSVRALLCGVRTFIGFDGLEITFIEDPGSPRGGRTALADAVPDYGALYFCGSDVIVLSFATCDRRAASAEMAALRALPDSPLIIVGGPHPSGLWFDALAIGADVVFTGEGEASFSRFLQESILALAAGDLKCFFDSLKTERDRFVGRILANPAAAAIEFGINRSDPGEGCYGAFPSACVRKPGDPVDLSVIPSFIGEFRLFGAVELTRGCHMECGFCQTPWLFPGRPRHRAPESVIRDVDAAGLSVVRFLCPDLFSYPWLVELLSGIRALPRIRDLYAGTFPGEVRPERITAEKLAAVAAHGSNRSIVIGGQSGSDRLLKAMGRGHTAQAILDGCALCHAHGFRAYLQMIAGIPGENDEDGTATARICAEAVSRWDARIHMHTFMPLPGASMGFMKPAPIGPSLTAFMNDYEGRGAIEGHWKSQDEGNREVAELYRFYGIW